MNEVPEITPGDILLEEFLEPMGISQNKLAMALKVPSTRINQIVLGRREITADTALRLGRFFGMEPQFWINLQTNYNMRRAREKAGSQIDEIQPLKKIA